MVQALLAISFVIGNVYKFSLFSPDVHFSILDCIILILTIIAIYLHPLEYINTLKKYRRLLVPIIVFFTFGLFTLIPALPIYKLSAIIVGLMYLLRWVLYTLFFTSIIQLIKLRGLLVLLGLLTAGIGLFQYFYFPDIRSLQVAEWDPHYFRVVGSFLDPGFTGLILVFTLITLTFHPLKNRIHQLTAWTVSYLAFALTYSRSSYLAFLAVMFFIALKVRGWKFFAKILLLFTLTIFLLPRAPDGEGVKLERTSSIQARIDNWKNSITIFADHPFTGVGFNTYRYAQKQYGFLTESKWLKSHAGAGADSSLLFVAATTGIPGLLVYLWYLRRLFLLSTMNYQLKATLVAVLVHSLFLNSLFYPFVMVWLSLLVLSGSDFPPGLSPQKPARSHPGSRSN